MADETRWLTASLLGSEPKAWGFASLLTFAQARALARTCTSCPLDHQDTALWDRALIAEGQLLLPRSHTLGAPLGRFQLEAATPLKVVPSRWRATVGAPPAELDRERRHTLATKGTHTAASRSSPPVRPPPGSGAFA